MVETTNDVIREFTKETSLQEYLGQRVLAQQLAYANGQSTSRLDTTAMAEEIVKLRAKVAALPPAPKEVWSEAHQATYRLYGELLQRRDAGHARWSDTGQLYWSETMRDVMRELLAP